LAQDQIVALLYPPSILPLASQKWLRQLPARRLSGAANLVLARTDLGGRRGPVAALAAMATVIGAAVAASAGTAATKAVFDYNRENFMEDREQRMKKEFKQWSYRVSQAKLWREDIRCTVSLTEKKMTIYLLVSVLLLSFTVMLWCEGKLPDDTPTWLMTGLNMAIAGAFAFFLLTVWLAMHASIAAQSYQVRLLTQLVRLPLPSWDELEACRTYGSEFEKLEPGQMFRVPFLTGAQESVAGRSLARPARLTAAEAGAAGPQAAADPWGLEQRRDDVEELGCQLGEDVAKLRHIKIMRQAAVYWQTYDAFARVSLSVGMNQLMLAMSYYVMGYVMTQVHTFMVAFAVVAILMGSARMLAEVDLTVSNWEMRLITALLFLGPGFSCLATYFWTCHHELGKRIAESLAPLAFISHSWLIGLLTFFLSVRIQENGAMLPLAFRGTLFLDVFGWVAHKKVLAPQMSETMGTTQPSIAAAPANQHQLTRADGAAAAAAGAPAAGALMLGEALPPPEVDSMKEGSGYWAETYAEEDFLRQFTQEDEEQGLNAWSASSRIRSMRPALRTVAYDKSGRPCPSRPEDTAGHGLGNDMRHVPGAPKMWEAMNAVKPPEKGFWDPVTFMPAEARNRMKMDSMLEEDLDGSKVEELPIVTGHDNEIPGILPWRIFRGTAQLTCLLWLLASIYYVLQVTGVWDLTIPWWWENEEHTVSTEDYGDVVVEVTQINRQIVPPPSLLGLWAASVSGGSFGPAAEHVAVSWPYPGIVPQSLACDATGHRLVVNDGLSVYATELIDNVGNQNGTMDQGASKLRGTASAAAATLTPVAKFWQAVSCPALIGESLQDAAIVCVAGATKQTDCEVLMLHRHGRQVSTCPLATASPGVGSAAVAGSEEPYTVAISPTWLQRVRRLGNAAKFRTEQVSWLAIDPSCGQGDNNKTGARAALRSCASVATEQGRVARLRHRSGLGTGGGEELVAADVLERLEGGHGGDDLGLTALARPDAVRAFGDRYLGILQAERRSIHVVDTADGGVLVGTLLLSVLEDVGAFCIGGRHVYIVGKGPNPKLWRLPVPKALRPNRRAKARRTQKHP